jgi:signal transduction histidine kinase
MVVLVLATVTWLLVGRALRPVERLRRQAADITATDLHSRLDVPASDDELSRLAATLNDLLSRIEESTRRQREFVADAAHELRSPLTSLRTQLEVAAGEPEPHLSREDLSGLLADASRLSRLVDDLLHLARLDARPQLRLRPVDLDDIVLSEARRARARAAPAVAVDTAAVSAGQVLGDADALTRMVRNLLDNATRYARSQVTLTLQTGGTGVVLAVWDDGAGIPRTARERIFGRFTRLDDSRTHRDDQEGVGLGLAIVRGVVTAHGGTVDVIDRADALPGAHFQVRLPVGPT